MEDLMPARRYSRVVFALLLVFGYVGPARIAAQSPRPMGLVDLLNVPRLADPQLSPDGRDVVFTRSTADWKSGRRVTHIWRARLAGGDPMQLTNGNESEN